MKTFLLLLFLFAQKVGIPFGPSHPDHPGQDMVVMTMRDLALIKLSAWQSGLEFDRVGTCEGQAKDDAVKESCKTKYSHLEFEAGDDSETIRIHAYYDKQNKVAKFSADFDCAEAKLISALALADWIKWERRDNGDPSHSF